MATAAEQISQIYVGYFNRAPDPAGLQYWITQLNNGMPLGEIADYFATEQETLDLYPYLREPDLNSVDDFINEIYANLFNRPADAAGLAFWKGQLESGAVSEGEFIAAIANGATGEGRLVLDNKVAVGVYFATELSQNNVAWTPAALEAAYDALAGVTLDPATVLEAKAGTDYFVQNGAWPGSQGETFNLTTSVDNFVGDASNDTVNGIVSNNPAQSPSTFNPLDSIDGGAGVNTLNLALIGLGDVALPNRATVTVENFQNVNLVSGDGGAARTTTTTAYALPTPVVAQQVAAIDARYFGPALEVLNQVDAANTVIHLQNGQTAAFTGDILSSPNTTATAPGPLRAEFDGTEADVVLNVETLRNGRVALEVNGGDVETLTISGNLGDGAGDLWLNTAASAAPDGAPATLVSGLSTTDLTTINLNLASDGEIFLGRGALRVIAGVETIDASGSTGDLVINFAEIATSLYVDGVAPATPVAELSLENVSFGSGNDLSNIILGSLTADDVSVDLGAGNDVFQIALGYTDPVGNVFGSEANLEIATGEGKDLLQFGSLVGRDVGGSFAGGFTGNVQINAAVTDFVGSVTITDFDSANDTIEISGFREFTAQNLIDRALASSDIDSLFDAVTAVADVAGAPGSSGFAQFVYEGNTYIYGDWSFGGGLDDGDLLIGFTGVVDLNSNNVSLFA